MWVHLFPSRTQKLSTCTPTILGGRLPGKIGNANTRSSTTSVVEFYIFGWEQWIVHLFPVGVNRCAPRRERRRRTPTPAHAAPSLHPPQAALGLAAIPNTEVKHMYADNTWRATRLLRCPKKSAGLRWSLIFSTTATRSPSSSRHWRQSARSPGKIGNANTRSSTAAAVEFLHICVCASCGRTDKHVCRAVILLQL